MTTAELKLPTRRRSRNADFIHIEDVMERIAAALELRRTSTPDPGPEQ